RGCHREDQGLRLQLWRHERDEAFRRIQREARKAQWADAANPPQAEVGAPGPFLPAAERGVSDGGASQGGEFQDFHEIGKMVVHPVEKCWINCRELPFSGEVKRWYPSWLSPPWAVSQPQRRQRSPPETLPRWSTQRRTAFRPRSPTFRRGRTHTRCSRSTSPPTHRMAALGQRGPRVSKA